VRSIGDAAQPQLLLDLVAELSTQQSYTVGTVRRVKLTPAPPSTKLPIGKSHSRHRRTLLNSSIVEDENVRFSSSTSPATRASSPRGTKPPIVKLTVCCCASAGDADASTAQSASPFQPRCLHMNRISPETGHQRRHDQRVCRGNASGNWRARGRVTARRSTYSRDAAAPEGRQRL
jgi:hypothetical protein